jgi:uncharacterized protein
VQPPGVFKWAGLTGWLLSVLLLCVSGLAQAQTFPKLTGRVVDAANIIPDDQEALLTAKLKAVETESSRQFVVATIPDLGGYDIAEYGYKLGDAWGIGQKGERNGIIMIVAPNERKVRVEVGYGLEPIVTDALSSLIIRTKILPAFKAGDMPAGIAAGADALITQLKLPPEEAAARARQVGAQQAGQSEGDSAGAVIFWLFVFFFFILPMIWPLFFGRRRGRSYGSGPVVIWGGGDWGGGGGGSSWGDGGGFSGGGGSFGGGGASGDWQ